MLYFYITTITFLALGQIVHSVPQSSVTDLPHFTKLNEEEVRHLQNRGFGPTIRSYTTAAIEEYEDTHTAASQQRTPTYAEVENPYIYQNAIPVRQKAQVREQVVQQSVRPRANYPQQFRPTPESIRNNPTDLKEKEEEEEIEEPDRLSLLLPNSKFTCVSKNTGYYADEDLGCEVFHYCQENAKHSWICPDGFTFHQVHLICMPPGGDNICEKSSQFHFVNEYLYKPLNLEEYQQKPNVSLKYSDRYYPENYYHEQPEGDQINHHRNSVRVTQDGPRNGLVARTTFRPETTIGQVFRSPNEVNIPLQHRRPPPQYVTQRYQYEEE